MKKYCKYCKKTKNTIKMFCKKCGQTLEIDTEVKKNGNKRI